MITLDFIPQTSNDTSALKFTVSDKGDKNALTTLLAESVRYGRSIELTAHEHDNTDYAPVNSMTFGIGYDSKQTGIISDSVFPTFFASGRHFSHLVVINTKATPIQISGGTTSGGFELFTSETIGASETKAIPLVGAYGLTTSAVTAFYIHHAGVDDTWNSIAADGITIKTISEAI
jgi:hypothetical protein